MFNFFSHPGTSPADFLVTSGIFSAMTRGARKDPKRLRNAKSLEDKLRRYDLDGQVPGTIF